MPSAAPQPETAADMKCRVDPIKVPRVMKHFTENDLVIREFLPHSAPTDGRRVLIYGAGDGGELLLRELRNNRELNLSPIGFLDDDPAKNGKVIHGLRVFGGNGDLGTVCSQHEVDEVVISSLKMTDERVQEVLQTCAEREITVKRMRITMEELNVR